MDSVVRLPLHRYQGVLWTIRVDVAGTERTFLLDLGAGVTILDSALAKELRLPIRGACQGKRMSGSGVEMMLHPGLPICLGDVALDPLRVASYALGTLLPADWPPLDGVLALDALEHVPFTLDLKSDELVLETQASFAARADDGQAMDIRLHRQMNGISLDVMVAVELAGAEDPLWFELDNANAGPVILSPAGAAALGLDPAGGEATLRIPGLGDVATPFAVKPIIYHGNLGHSVLSGRTLAFDLANERVYAG